MANFSNKPNDLIITNDLSKVQTDDNDDLEPKYSIPVIDEINIDDQFKCPECKNVFENVHQADDCGCRFCYNCLDKM
jgi:protein-arginine kinase activator protein McsA